MSVMDGLHCANGKNINKYIEIFFIPEEEKVHIYNLILSQNTVRIPTVLSQ